MSGTQTKAPISGRATTLILNYGLAAAGRGTHIEETGLDLRNFISELEANVISRDDAVRIIKYTGVESMFWEPEELKALRERLRVIAEMPPR